MEKRSLVDEDGTFEVAVIEAERPARAVLFAVGGGGDPERHGPLLAALAARGCTVVAPCFERLTSPMPTREHLLCRARRFALALDAVARKDVPVAGVGHSIGAAVLLALAGARMWLREGEPLPIAPIPRLEHLVLLAPATGFFQAPGALDAVRAPTLAFAGTRDAVTPPAQAELLRTGLEGRAPMALRRIEGAGHFSFMDTPPPGFEEPLPDREAFLAALAEEIGEFVVG